MAALACSDNSSTWRLKQAEQIEPEQLQRNLQLEQHDSCRLVGPAEKDAAWLAGRQ